MEHEGAKGREERERAFAFAPFAPIFTVTEMYRGLSCPSWSFSWSERPAATSHRVQLNLREIAKDGSLVSTRLHLPYDPRLVKRARELRRNVTLSEKKLVTNSN